MAKQILSEGCIKRQIAEGTNKGVHGKLVEVDGPTALWTTTTRVKTDYELSNRVFELSPDDSRAQTRSIIKNVFEDDRNEVDFGPVKALFTWIAGQDNRVVIPFGSALGDLLPDSSVRMRREAIRVRNLICAHAVLHQASRERDERDRIVATLEDYEAVRRLVEDIVGATAEKSVRPEVRETVEAAQTLIESEEHDHAGVTISEMEARLNRDYSTTSRRMKAASPYLVELEEKRGRSKQFAIGVDLPAEANVLPTVDEVCKFACVCGSGGAEAEHDGNCAVSARKIRANVRANFDEYVPVDDDKTHILGENSDQHEGEPTESGLSENYLQTCKLHDGDCPTPELCVQNCANFAGDILKDEHAALIARMIRSHANKCKLHGRVIPDNFIDWQRELYKEYDFEASFEDLALGFEYIGAENEEWRATVRALESIEIVQESTDVAYAYDAIQEIRNDLQGYKKLPTDAESWHRILEVNDKPCTLETIEAALALAG